MIVLRKTNTLFFCGGKNERLFLWRKKIGINQNNCTHEYKQTNKPNSAQSKERLLFETLYIFCIKKVALDVLGLDGYAWR